MRTLIAATAAALLLTPAAIAQEAPEGGAWADCTVSEIAAYRDRVEVACSAPAAKIAGETPAPRRFAVEMRDPLADPLIRLAMEAKGRTRTLSVLYVKAEGANPDGCDAKTCRRAAGVVLK